MTQLVGANGVVYEGGKIYAVQLGGSVQNLFGGGGRLVEIDAKSGKVTELGGYIGILDGIQKVGDAIYFSDWVKFEKMGVMRVYNLKTKAEGELTLEKMGGPADFAVDKKAHKLWIPKMLEGKVLAVDLR